MRRWMYAALMLISIGIFLILFRDADVKQSVVRDKAMAGYTSYNVMIPSAVAGQSQEEVYNKITEVLNKYKGNIYYKRIVPGTSNTIVYTYFTNKEYFKSFDLAKGRSFELSERDSDKFLSTEDSGDKNQIGVIADFGGNDFFEIRTLKAMIKDNQLYNGYCYVQFVEEADINSFTKELSNYLGGKVQSEALLNIPLRESNLIYVMTIVSYITLMLLVLYDILKSYKKIGIQKMLGYSTRSIWLRKVLSLVLVQVVIFAVTSAICSLFKFKTINQLYWSFMLKILVIDLLSGITSFLVYSIPFLYVSKVKVSDIIKNRQPIRVVFAANIIFKIAFMVFFVLALNTLSQNFGRIQKQFTHSYGQWEKTKAYAIVPSYKDIDIKYSMSQEYNSKAKQIYEYFNKKGALLADFTNFAPQQSLDIKEVPEPWKRDWINVNPNYLEENPIYDVEGSKVTISETENDFTVLIPEKYKYLETDIRAYLDYWKKGYPESDRIPVEKVKLIWIKSGQSVFSYNMEISPNNGNMVTDALIRVVTEANASKYDYLFVALSYGSPFKIKVDNPANPAGSILPKFKELKLDVYRPVITSVYDAVAVEIKNARDLASSIIVSIIPLLFIIILIIFQNIYSYFDVNKQRLTIQQFHGYKKFDKYKSYFVLVVLSWIIIFNLTFFIKNTGILAVTDYTTSIQFNLSINARTIGILSSVLTIVEIVMSLIVLTFVEKRKAVNIIKGAN